VAAHDAALFGDDPALAKLNGTGAIMLDTIE
jgi:hypothetical protein